MGVPRVFSVPHKFNARLVVFPMTRHSIIMSTISDRPQEAKLGERLYEGWFNDGMKTRPFIGASVLSD